MKQQPTLGVLGLLALLFLIIISLSNMLLGGIKIDLTEDGLHTLSDGTQAVLANMEEPVTLRFFYSKSDAQDNPQLRGRGRQLIDMLKEFDSAGDKLKVKFIYPEPFSDDALKAEGFGLEPVSYGQYSTPVYMGLVATNSLSSTGALKNLAQGNLQYRDHVEYEVARLVYELSHPRKRKIGVITSLPMLGVPNPIPNMSNPSEWQTLPWIMVQVVEQLFEIDSLGPNPTSIPDDLDALWVVHPKDVSDATIFAIDQYVLAGGPAVIFVDPFAEIDQPKDEFGMATSRSSDLAPLFDAWKINYDSSLVVLDAEYAMPEAGNHPAFLRVLEGGLNRGDVITADINGRVNIGLAGAISQRSATTEGDSNNDSNSNSNTAVFTPLLTSSEAAGTVNINALQNAQPSALVNKITDPESQIIAARLSGELTSAFNSAPEGYAGEFNKTGQAQVLIVADVDILTDRLWYETQQNANGQVVPYQQWAANDSLVIGMLGAYSGGEDLLNIRARSRHRSFDVVEDALQEANDIAERKQKELEAKITESNAELQRLQVEAATQTGQLDLEALEAQGDKVEKDIAAFRRELNQVRYNLIREHEMRGNILLALTMLVVPLLLIIVAILVAVRRNHLRASKQMI